MNDYVFVLALGSILIAFLVWGFRVLPRRHWQFLAVVPGREKVGDQLAGLNLTYYGLFSATGFAGALALLLCLCGAAGVASWKVLLVAVGLTLPSVLASRWIARWVEKKPYTFTVAGASFTGLLVLPLVLAAVDTLLSRLGQETLPRGVILSALALALTLGEGLGRLACISFGCCYGKPLDALPAWWARRLACVSFVFEGATKKIAYASSLEGVQVVPIQAWTALLYVVTSLVGVFFFLQGRFLGPMLGAVIVTQGWRIFSESLRADHRGSASWTSYQVMAALSIVLAAALSFFVDWDTARRPDIVRGIAELWQPLPILLIQVIWLLLFLRNGRSQVTGSFLTFYVHEDRI